MEDYGLSSGVPETPSVGSIGEKNYKNPQQKQNKQKEKKKENKPSVLPKQDEVILSSNVQAPQEKQTEPEDDNELDSQDESQTQHPGDKVDIKI